MRLRRRHAPERTEIPGLHGFLTTHDIREGELVQLDLGARTATPLHVLADTHQPTRERVGRLRRLIDRELQAVADPWAPCDWLDPWEELARITGSREPCPAYMDVYIPRCRCTTVPVL